ncbi:MAG: hypothetical protein JWP51_170 [Bradyrhizobium sp.]|jgi:hypothetical protein|nr:hypothetical protein [Bradyrhizobium sp.]
MGAACSPRFRGCWSISLTFRNLINRATNKETTQETGHLTRDLAASALGVETAPNFLNPASEPSPLVQGIFEPE